MHDIAVAMGVLEDGVFPVLVQSPTVLVDDFAGAVEDAAGGDEIEGIRGDLGVGFGEGDAEEATDAGER